MSAQSHKAKGDRNRTQADVAPPIHRVPSSAASSTATAASSVPNSNVASLIQSAARMSLLHDTSSSEYRRPNRDNARQPLNHNDNVKAALFADDEYDNMDQNLQSLRKVTLPAMPDEQDRKRFVGCLAAVMASLYDYDCLNEDDRGDNQNNKLPKTSSLDASDSFYDSLDDSWYDTADKDDDDENDIGGGPDSKRHSRHQHSIHHQQSASSSNPIHAGRELRPEGDVKETAQTRHRKRRYAVFSRLLASSAELLQLDKVHSMGLLPVLDKLLIPSANNRASRRRKSNRSTQSLPNESTNATNTSNNSGDNAAHSLPEALFLDKKMNQVEHLRPFLEGLGHGAGFRCVAMFLLLHLLHSPKGYDARVRQAIKSVGVIVLVHDAMLERQQSIIEEIQRQQHRTGRTFRESSGVHPGLDDGAKEQTSTEPTDFVALATRKFESLEQFVARKLVEISKGRNGDQNQGKKQEHVGSITSWGGGISSRDRIIRGLKIGGTAVAAGTLFAITGGLAAPGIAAGIAAIAGTTVVATAAAALTTTAAVTTIFGVGGGGLVAYKMQRRTIGLTEFEFSKEIPKDQTKPRHRMLQNRASIDDEIPVVELFSTICISGWLRDDCDFQRPWGLSPTHPPIADKLELLERFYSVHRPRHVSKCANILSQWKGEEKQLWDLIRQNYGRDPSHLFPLDDGPRHGAVVSLEEEEVVCQLLSQLGYTATWSHDANVPMRDRQMGPIERMRYGDTAVGSSRSASLRRRQTDEIHVPSIADNDFDNNSSLEDDSENSKTKHLATVWDYEATYGGELYTVRWESSLIEELCNSVTDLAAGVVTGATTHLLKFTALSTLVAAMALPAALKSAANLIDGTWTLVVERADEAGRELANSLLFSSAGNRPVTLAGFSFGARVIYSCLKELARLQGQWEEYQIRRENTERGQYRLNPLSRENIDTYYESMREPASIVGDAILMGLPNHFSVSSWHACRNIVAGRLVNCYSQNDLILSLMFQYKKFGLKPVCGTCAVAVQGVENVDVSDLVSGHQDYCMITGEILKLARFGEPFSYDESSTSMRQIN